MFKKLLDKIRWLIVQLEQHFNFRELIESIALMREIALIQFPFQAQQFPHVGR